MIVTILLALLMATCKTQEVPESPSQSMAEGLVADPLLKQEPLLAQEKLEQLWQQSSDFSRYRQAIETARPHDTVRIAPGLYRIDRTVQINTDHLTIIGDRSTLISRSNQNFFQANDVRHLTMKSLSAVNHTPASIVLLRAYGGSDLSLISCETNNLGLLGLFKNSQGTVHRNLQVVDCKVSNAGTDGVKLQGVDGFLIKNSMFINSKGDGIKTNLAPCKNGLITGCYFEGNDDDGFDLFGGGSDIVIDSCKFVNQKLQLKNIGGQYYRPEIRNCTIRRSTFINSSIICLSKFVPGTEFQGLQGIKIDHNQWINQSGSCFQTNGAVNYQFTNNHLVLTNFQKALDIRPPLGQGLISNNIIESKIEQLVTDPKKGTYLLEIKAQSDKNFGFLDEESNLIISGNTFINGRRDYKLEGLANYQVLDNRSIGQRDKSMYQGVLKEREPAKDSRYQRQIRGNTLEQ